MHFLDKAKVENYRRLTEEALAAAKKAPEHASLKDARRMFIDTVERYLSDARHFSSKGDLVNAFAAINYAHGWLDAGARIGLWVVHDSRLFAVDGE